jgi:hypothetical protein
MLSYYIIIDYYPAVDFGTINACSFRAGSLTVDSLGTLTRLSDSKPVLLPVDYRLVLVALIDRT